MLRGHSQQDKSISISTWQGVPSALTELRLPVLCEIAMQVWMIGTKKLKHILEYCYLLSQCVLKSMTLCAGQSKHCHLLFPLPRAQSDALEHAA